MHQIRFLPGLCLGPRWGSSRLFSKSSSRLERPSHSPSPRCLQCLVLGACGASPWVRGNLLQGFGE